MPPPPLESFPTFIESHGVLDPTVFEQTQALHYFSPILDCGCQFLKDQSDVQRALAHRILTHKILCPVDAPILNKTTEFFSHGIVSHPLLSWSMHVPTILYVPPWNPHALKNIQLTFLPNNNQVQR